MTEEEDHSDPLFGRVGDVGLGGDGGEVWSHTYTAIYQMVTQTPYDLYVPENIDTSLDSLLTNGSLSGSNLSMNGTGPRGSRLGPMIPSGTDTIKYVTAVSYLATFIFGVLGNTLVLYIIARFGEVREKSVANYYIFNLALADEIYILTLPVFSFVSISQNWVFGEAMCTISNILHSINKFGSVFTLVALSMDRYVASFHNLGHLRTIRVGTAICVLIWVLSLAMCTPDMLYSTTNVRGNRTSCGKIWPKSNLLHRRIWAYSELTIGLIIPFCLIIISYALLVRRLHAIMKPRKSDRIRKPNRKMTRTIFVVVVIFLFCNLPYYIIQILNNQKMEAFHNALKAGRPLPSSSKGEVDFYRYFNMTATILVFISSCCNPVIYGILNENYRKLYRIALCSGSGNRTGRTSNNSKLMSCLPGGGNKGSYDSVNMSHRNNNTQIENVSPAKPSDNVVVHHTTGKNGTGDQCDTRIVAAENSSFV